MTKLNKLICLSFAVIFTSCFSLNLSAAVFVGIGKSDITPPIGTPSAGYAARKGAGMEGIHDPLLAIAMAIDNGEKKIVFCSVDHLGFTHEMVQEVIHQVHLQPELEHVEIYVGSSHTHSGGGAFLDMPIIGEALAGAYSPSIANYYIANTAQAIIQACQNMQPAKIGVGYGQVNDLTKYRSIWPKAADPLNDVAVIKISDLEEKPIAVLFNFAVHPTILEADNKMFSADFVGYARDHIKALIGHDVEAIYFNGAQGDIAPNVPNGGDRFNLCDEAGRKLAERVSTIWDSIETEDHIDIITKKKTYSFNPLSTPFGLQLPLDKYLSEINLIILDRKNVFVTIPGELSCIYDRRFKLIGKDLGLEHISILGLCNDAHGYIILPEAWRMKTYESQLSFGGENYGERIEGMVSDLLNDIVSNEQSSY